MEERTVLFIVHSPPSDSTTWGFDGLPNTVNKVASHRSKLAHAIRAAIRNKIDIFVECANEIQEERARKFLREIEVEASNVKMVYTYVVYGEAGDRSTVFGNTPTWIFVAGVYKERCLVDSIKYLREKFPNSEIIVLKGDYCVSARNDLHYRPSPFSEEKKHFKDRKVEDGFRIKPYRRNMFVH